MVAIRGTHLLKAENFDVYAWCESLQLPMSVRGQLVSSWQYCATKMQSLPEENQKPHYLLAGAEMVEILQALNMDAESLQAAMLYPLVLMKQYDFAEIEECFGKSVKKLLRSIVEMDNIRQLNTVQSANNVQLDNIRRMLLAMVDDFRCVVIKLAERIIFLRDDANLHSEEEKVLAAKECSNIYAPLANRLGIGQLKWELEDYCFRVLHPDTYREIANLLKERRLDREHYIADFVSSLQEFLTENHVENAEVYGRPKHIYSIWKKMQKKHVEFSELYDVRAVRIIVQKLQDCYAALGVVHTHFKHLPKEFDDYVANPKPNGYQSIHTVVLGKGGKAVEVQIRTQQMHDDAELGVAAHWKYKEGITGGKSGYEEKIAWLRKLLAWQDDIADSGEIMAEVRSQVFDDRVYVFTPKGEVVDLPTCSTPLDFAYAIHSEIGHRCIGAKVAGRIVPFTYPLQMGDQVEILTQKNPAPSRDWLNPNLGFTHTAKARSKINAFFKKQDREKNIPAGKELVENELPQLGLTLKQLEKVALDRYQFKQIDDFYAALGAGDIRLVQLINFLQNRNQRTNAEKADAEILRQVGNRSINKVEDTNDRVIVDGVGNLLHYMAGCCQPIYGEPIIGYITMGRGISIHRTDCDQFLEMQSTHPERVVEAHWGKHFTHSFRVSIQIVANERPGMLRDITTVLANAKINVMSVNSRTDRKQQLAYINMEIELKDVALLNKILLQIVKIPDVMEAKRL